MPSQQERGALVSVARARGQVFLAGRKLFLPLGPLSRLSSRCGMSVVVLVWAQMSRTIVVVRLKAVRRKQKAAPAAVSLGCLGSLLCVQTENCTTLSETHCVFCDCLRSFVYAQNNYNLVEGLNLVGYHILQSSSVFSLMTGNTLLVQKSTIHFFLFFV